MAVATTVRRYLDSMQVGYEVIQHPPRTSAQEVAEAAHIPGDKLAKAVLFRDPSRFFLAVLPSSHQVQVDELAEVVGQPVALATESDVAVLFNDCELGAVPALGPAYQMDVVLDEQLTAEPDIYFEGGDHISLVHVDGQDFIRVLRRPRRGPISRHI